MCFDNALDAKYNLIKSFPLIIGHMLTRVVGYDILPIELAYVAGQVRLSITH